MTLLERWSGLSGRERMLVGSAAAIALLVVLRFVTLEGEEEVGAVSDDAPWVQVAKIESYRRLAAREKALDAQSGELEKRFADQQTRLNSGATATQVAAELQGAIGGMAGDAGLNVLSSQILKEEETEGFKRVGVRLTLSGSLDGVTRLLSSIEGGDKDMVVTHLEINRKLGTTRRPSTARTPAAPEPAVAPLTVSLEVRTFMRQQS